MERKHFDLTDINELRSLVGDPIFEEFLDSILVFIRPDDSDYVKSVKRTFVRHQFIQVVESLRSSNYPLNK